MSKPTTCRSCGKEVTGRVRRGRCRGCYYQALEDHDRGFIDLSTEAGQQVPLRGGSGRTFFNILAESRAAANECWEWTGERNDKGYGRVTREDKHTGAHRAVYELLIGPIPEGLVLDHLCRNPPCVNPAHLEPVTNRANILRGIGVGAVNAQKTHCIRGHAFTPTNILRQVPNWPGGPDRRSCRTCRREQNREVMRARRARAKEGSTS